MSAEMDDKCICIKLNGRSCRRDAVEWVQHPSSGARYRMCLFHAPLARQGRVDIHCAEAELPGVCWGSTEAPPLRSR